MQKKKKKEKKKKYRVSGFKVTQTQNGRTMLLSKCVVLNKKKSRFMEELEAKGILSSLGLETPLGKIQLLGDILF